MPMDSPGRSGAKFFVSYDKKLVIKNITGEEVALLHQILQSYHAVSIIILILHLSKCIPVLHVRIRNILLLYHHKQRSKYNAIST